MLHCEMNPVLLPNFLVLFLGDLEQQGYGLISPLIHKIRQGLILVTIVHLVYVRDNGQLGVHKSVNIARSRWW